MMVRSIDAIQKDYDEARKKFAILLKSLQRSVDTSRQVLESTYFKPQAHGARKDTP